jgi:hypothetical protein
VRGDIAHIEMDVPRADSRSIWFGELSCPGCCQGHGQQQYKRDPASHGGYCIRNTCEREHGWTHDTKMASLPISFWAPIRKVFDRQRQAGAAEIDCRDGASVSEGPVIDRLDPVVHALGGSVRKPGFGPGEDRIQMRPEHAHEFLETKYSCCSNNS